MITPAIGLTKRSIDVLIELPSLEGLSAYMIARRLSLKLNLASSTTKFALTRLEYFGLIKRDGVVALTKHGRAFIATVIESTGRDHETERKEIKVHLWQ